MIRLLATVFVLSLTFFSMTGEAFAFRPRTTVIVRQPRANVAVFVPSRAVLVQQPFFVPARVQVNVNRGFAPRANVRVRVR